MASIKKFLTWILVSTFMFMTTVQNVLAASVGTVEQLISAAKSDDSIEFYAPSTLTPKGSQELAAAFNKKYGRARDMAMDVSKVVSQSASGVPPEWDLMVVTDAHHATLWLKKLHQPFSYAKFNVTPKAIDYDSGTISIVNQVVLPAYNNKLVTPNNAPKRWEDLLDPKWSGGKLGMPNILASSWVRLWSPSRCTTALSIRPKQRGHPSPLLKELSR